MCLLLYENLKATRFRLTLTNTDTLEEVRVGVKRAEVCLVWIKGQSWLWIWWKCVPQTPKDVIPYYRWRVIWGTGSRRKSGLSGTAVINHYSNVSGWWGCGDSPTLAMPSVLRGKTTTHAQMMMEKDWCKVGLTNWCPTDWLFAKYWCRHLLIVDTKAFWNLRLNASVPRPTKNKK